jgi:formylglycine-generating enzyme required for sulfatase activity
MSYCISRTCPAPNKNSPDTNFCMSCGAKILLKDRYRALKLLGQGGFGKTFQAVDEDQPRKPLCVIKQFAFNNNDPTIRQIALKLFYEEARHLEALGTHEQIPELLAYFDVEGQPYLVQQFIDGQDLERELFTTGTFNQAKIRELLELLLPVLDFIHHQSPPVIHRDIKPANILRRSNGAGLVVVDFGAAKKATQTMLAKPGTAIGSAEFAAPEQARGKAVFASDIYSLGVTCIFLLTKVSPFDLFDPIREMWIWRDYLVDNPVDEKLGRVLDKMLAKFIPDRYKSAKDVLADLNNSAIGQVSSLPLAEGSQAVSLEKSAVIKSNSEIVKFEAVQMVTVKKNITRKISVKKGIIFKRWVEQEIEETIESLEIQRRKCKAYQLSEHFINGVKLEMVYIPDGSFMMGSHNISDNASPLHKVILEPFFIGKYPITQEQYRTVMGINPSSNTGDRKPVTSVSWEDTIRFCQQLSEITGKRYTLPSESQWEYSCRAGTTTRFYFGETINAELMSVGGTVPTSRGARGVQLLAETVTTVGSFPPNTFGLYDLHGNVAEWCLDTWHENYDRAPVDGSAWIDRGNDLHLLRGGVSLGLSHEGSSLYRDKNKQNVNSNSYGFRVVCTPSASDRSTYENWKLQLLNKTKK